MSDKPLHVRVAEALGTLHVLGAKEQYVDAIPRPRWNRTCTIHGDGPYDLSIDYDGKIIAPNYDTDSSATGPLIEKYSIALLSREDYGPGNREPYRGRVWWALFEPHYGHDGEAYDDFEDAEDRPEHKTPLEAVCWLLLHMGKAGKL